MDRSRGERIRPPAPRRTAFRFGGFELHPGRQLLRDGVPVPLGRIAIDLLGALVQAHGRLVSKEELFDAAWSDVVVVENALHQHMRALRQALGDQAGLIVTVARAGYCFAGDCEEVSLESAAAGESDEGPPLPAALAPLIGREDELQAIEGLLGERRCVTLLGPGGVGKTRLALEVARRWADRTTSKAHWVELAATADAASVAGAVAAAFGLAGPSSVPPLARIRHALREARALLVLDNCEHLVEACAAAIHELLQTAPGLKILATSQRPLGVAGEHRVRLAMLGLPPPGTVDPELLAAAPAVRLLMARLGDCSSQLTFDDEDLRSAAELCRKLDGNALAIELAAARVAALGLAATHSALAGRFDLLAAGPRDVLPKHRSLDAMIDWSHALLSAEQALVFRRLGVFAGGWTMASAIAMLDSVGLHDLTEVASRLSELVECSMIVSEGSAQSPRFRMLEAQRFYALEKLQAHGEHERCASEHAAHVAALFEASYLGWDSAPDAAWIAGYGPERDNLRAAIRFAAAASDATLLARLVGSSIWLWRAIGAMHELRQLLQHPLLQATAPAASQARLKLALAYSLHATSSESSSVQSAAAQAVTAFEGVDDVIGAANSLLCLASAFAQLGSTAMHQACLDRIDAVLREHRSGKAYAWYCGSHAWAAQLGGNVRAALSWASRSRAAYRDCHARHGETRAMLHLADLRLAAGEVERAIAMGQECVGRLQGDLHREDLGRALANLGAAWFARGDLDQARSCWARALDELRRLDFSYWVFDHIALLAIAEGRDDDAAQMLGYAEAGYIRFRKGRRVQNEQRAHDQALAHLEARHSAEELAMWLTAGATASEDAVIALATQPGIARAG